MRNALGLTLALALAGCDDRPNQWDAMIYPDSESDEGVVTVRGFKSDELCRQAAIERLYDMGAEERGTFACGWKCGYKDEFGGLWSCKEVVNAEDF